MATPIKPPPRCKRPGCTARAEKLPGGGRQPLYCKKHRPASRSIDGEKEVARRASRHRATKELAAAESSQRDASTLLALAAVLPIAGDDPDEACAWAGLQERGEAAAALVTRAKARHAELISGEPQALDRIVRASIIRLASVGAMSPEAIAPAQRPGAAFALGRLRETMGLSSLPRFSSIVLEVVGPAGERLVIGPTNTPEETHGPPGTDPV